MGVLHHRRRIILLLTAFTLVSSFLASASAIATLSSFLGGASSELERVGIRRRLGPGSWPPTCRSKCAGCSPCRAVHVPIQPGLSRPLEYYPEAWRCKCGNTLYMP